MSPADILNLEKDQLTDPDSGSGHEPDKKIVEFVVVPNQAFFQVLVIRLADDIVQKCLLLYFQHGQSPVRNLSEFQKTVDSADAQIDSLGLVVFQQVTFVQLESLVVHLVIQLKKLPDSKAVDLDRIVSLVSAFQPLAEIFQNGFRFWDSLKTTFLNQ